MLAQFIPILPNYLENVAECRQKPERVKTVEGHLFILRHLLFLCHPPFLQQLHSNKNPCLPHFHSDPDRDSNIYMILQLLLSLHVHHSLLYFPTYIVMRGCK